MNKFIEGQIDEFRKEFIADSVFGEILRGSVKKAIMWLTQAFKDAQQEGAKEERKFIGKNKRAWFNHGFKEGQEAERNRIYKLIEDKYYGANNPKISDILKDLEKKPEGKELTSESWSKNRLC